MKNSLLTKVAKGVAFGDVSNVAVRNILTEISKAIQGNFTEQEIRDTLDRFGWRCPYTGKDLRPLIENDLGGYATDHIYPQNKVWCGLNVKGNLIMVDKTANARKRDLDVETFLLTDTKVITDIDELGRTRQERLDLIKAFQASCGYDPHKIRQVVSGLLVQRYEALRKEQERNIEDALAALQCVGINPLAQYSAQATCVLPVPTTRASKTTTSLIFYPANETQFKQELLRKKKARFVLTYDTGAVKESFWDASDFDASSNLKRNIQSRPFWRKKQQEGLLKVEVYIV